MTIKGQDVIDRLLLLEGQKREDAVLSLASDPSNSPSWMYALIPISWTATIDGTPRTIQIQVAPDWLSLGFDTTGFLRVPMWPATAQQLADQMGMILPSRFLSKKIQELAFLTKPFQVVPAALPRPSPRMETTEAWVQSQDMCQKALGDYPPGALIAGFKKDVVVGPNLDGSRVAIYGAEWTAPGGALVQPYSTIHQSSYSDYSHGIRFISRECQLDGKNVDIYTIFADPKLSALVSDQGPFAPRFPNATTTAVSTSGDSPLPNTFEQFVDWIDATNEQLRQEAPEQCATLCNRINAACTGRPWFHGAEVRPHPQARKFPMVVVKASIDIPRDWMLKLWDFGRQCAMRFEYRGGEVETGRGGGHGSGVFAVAGNARGKGSPMSQTIVGRAGGGHGGGARRAVPAHVLHAHDRLREHFGDRPWARGFGITDLDDGRVAVALHVDDYNDDLRREIRAIIESMGLQVPVAVAEAGELSALPLAPDGTVPALAQPNDNDNGNDAKKAPPSTDAKKAPPSTEAKKKAPEPPMHSDVAMLVAGIYDTAFSGMAMRSGASSLADMQNEGVINEPDTEAIPEKYLHVTESELGTGASRGMTLEELAEFIPTRRL